MSHDDVDPVFDSGDSSLYAVATTAPGPTGRLPVDEISLPTMSSGDLFGWTQNAAMGIDPVTLRNPEYLILSTMGGIRAPDGTPIALGYHTGHWEVGLMVEAAAREFTSLGASPFSASVTDPCDGRTNGTSGMFDSLPYRNDAAIVLRRLVRSLPTRRGVLGVATCDKGLPAMMMALAGTPDLPSVIVPGGVMLIGADAEDTAKVQTLATRFARGEIDLEYAAYEGCRACGSAGGGCQFMGTAATSQVVAEALGMALPHSALSPSGAPIWLDMARRSARALTNLARRSVATRDVVTSASFRNAMVVHAAVGGSTNLVLHLPAIAHAAGVERLTAQDWAEVSRSVPRIVDALPNGPRNFATIQVFLAGGAPEVMVRLAERGLLDLEVMTVTGRTLGDNLDWWQGSERRDRLRTQLFEVDGIDPDDVIRIGDSDLGGTMCIVGGNLAPDGALVKATAINRSSLADGVYDVTGNARVFTTETAAIDAIKSRSIESSDVIVLQGLGPRIGMPETYQVTAALKHIDPGGDIPLITDGRFSGVSTGPCVGHVSPEAPHGPIGRLRDGDLIRVRIDTRSLEGAIDFVGDIGELMSRPEPILPREHVPIDTRLWAALQAHSGGSWGGAVYDVDAIEAALGSA
jgi:putative YjhG/YagF family dehydratase